MSASNLLRTLLGRGHLAAIAKGTAWNIVGSLAFRVLILAAMVVAGRVLGPADFGAFGVLVATFGVLGLFAGSGLGAVATRFLAQHKIADPARAGRGLALVYSSSAIALSLAIVVLAVFGPVIAASVLKDASLSLALLFGGGYVVGSTLRGIQIGALSAFNRFDSVAKLNAMDGAISLAAVAGLTIWLGLEGAVLGLAVGPICAWLVGQRMLLRTLRNHRITVQVRNCWSEWRLITSSGLPSVLAGVVGTPALWWAMALVARTDGGLADLGLYNAAYQWHGPALFLPMAATSVSVVHLVEAWERGSRAEFRSIARYLNAIVLVTSLPVAVVGIALASWVMSLYGAEYANGSGLLILVLAAAPLHAVSRIAFSAIFAMNHAWWVLLLNVGWGAILLIVTASLLPTHGVSGLAIAFLAAHATIAALASATAYVASRTVSGRATLLPASTT